MVNYKYVDSYFLLPDEDVRTAIFIFNGCFKHSDIMSMVTDHCKIDHVEWGYLSAGGIRLSHEGYVSFGTSLSLGIGGSLDAGTCVTSFMKEGLEFMVTGHNVIVATKGFFKMEPGFKGGSIAVTEDRSQPDVALVYKAEVQMYHEVNPEEVRKIQREVERVINCGNID